MSIQTFAQIFSSIDGLENPLPVAVIGGEEPTVLQALDAARLRGWIQPIVTGNQQEIEALAKQLQIDLNKFEIIDTDQPAVVAVEQVTSDRARLLMKGNVSTPELMRAVLDRKKGLRTDATICQVVLLQLPRQKRSIVLADTGICVEPTVEQRVEIMAASAQIARTLGAEKPKIALMAATEKPTPAMPDSMESEKISCRFNDPATGESNFVELLDCFVQGPMSFDLAFDNSAASRKKQAGPVVGNAEVMIFPNLVAANLTVKAIMYTAECEFGGILCGTQCPVVFMSRSDTKETRLRSIALAIKTLQ